MQKSTAYDNTKANYERPAKGSYTVFREEADGLWYGGDYLGNVFLIGGGLPVIKAYASLKGSGNEDSAPQSPIVFNLGTVGAIKLFSPAAPGLNIALTAPVAGDYRFDFAIDGCADDGSGSPLVVLLSINESVAANPSMEFQSNYSTSIIARNPTDILKVVGNGLITLAAGDTVSLINRTGAGAVGIAFQAFPQGGEAAVNAYLTLEKVN
jgi:hypothetical protein